MLFKSSVVIAVLASFTLVRGAPAASSSSIPSASIPQPPPVPTVTNAPEIASELKSAASIVDRFNKLLKPNGTLLTGDELRQLTVFDFNNQTPGPGGSILLAVVDDFPILEGLGISAGVSFIKPCGFNIPHNHPRASEMLTVVEGILYTGFIQENGFNTDIETQLGTFQGTVFPMGSIHYQYNPTCSPAVFVAALGNEDPGRSDIATNYWMLPDDVINAALGFPTTVGGEDIDAWRVHLPPELALGVESCLAACGLNATSPEQ